MYQLMEGYWPKAVEDLNTSKDDLEVARLMNNTSKIVFSRTLDRVDEHENWRSVRLVKKFSPEEIVRLKEQTGKSIGVGGSELAVSFIKVGLIDEFRFMVNPTVIGAGTPIFTGLCSKLRLKLISTRTFRSGKVLLNYEPFRSGEKEKP